MPPSALRALATLFTCTLAAPLSAGAPGWTAEGSGNELVLAVPADEGVLVTNSPGPYQRSSKVVPRLVVRCHGKSVRAGIDSVGLNTGEVTFRLDQDPPANVVLRAMTSQKEGLLHKLTSDARDYENGMYFDEKTGIVASLLAHRRLVMRLTPQGQPSQQIAFDVSGLDPHLARLEQACGVVAPLPRTAAPAVAAAAPAAPASGTESDTIGKWLVRRIRSELDVQPAIILTQESATEVAWDSQRRYKVKPVLMLRCRQKAGDAYVDFGHVKFPGNGRMLLQASVDSTKQAEWALDPSTDRSSFFFLETAPVVKRMLASRELRLRFGPKKPEEWASWMPAGEAVYDMTGFAEAVKPFLEACSYDMSRTRVKDGLAKLP